MPEGSSEGRERLVATAREDAAENRRLTSHRFFFGYAYDALTHTHLFAHWQRLLSLLRRFRALAIVGRVLTLIFTVLETGTLVLLTTAVFLVILPLLGALMLGILITALLESRRTNRQMRRLLDGKRVYVLFLSTRPNDFLERNARQLSACEDTAVIVVSPYLISARGLRKGRFYCTARRECERLYLVRRYYFFSLRKHAMQQSEVAVLY